ncbi:MAG TPA: PPE domain-containing protein [Nocardia sp.]|uniref:PPE domain-containing protein n=1 Tax=Nocardia sp. TaxID=1821 RepID=UPI002B4AC25A|nr:PPE domain-containing protein [Nocardia sp.]HLS78611.1 PPE domain-containing protein [Nocardia sp.]
MTLGITGVFWLPRMAEANSVTLNAGARAVPISAASTSWGTLTAAWTDATATLVRVMAELGIGMQGVNGIAALARLVQFTSWTAEQSALAASMSAKAATNATAYTVASIAMPSLPEIAAVNAAVVASANPPGAVSGALEAAEVAKTAMDVRAALVMETYEAATTAVVTTPGEFRLPPRIAEGAGTADAASAAQSSFQDDPLQTAVAGAVSALNHAGALNHAANVATTVASSGASTVGNLGAGAIAAAANSAPAMAAAPAGLAGAGLAAGVGGAGLAATHAATVGIGSTALPNGSVQLPPGWGSGMPAASAPAAASTDVVARVDSAAARPAAAGSPLLGRTAQSGQDDEGEHKAADYLRADHFSDGRVAADGVIGAAAVGPQE